MKFEFKITRPPAPALYKGFRGLHVVEGGRDVPTGMPAILNPIETRALSMTEEIQRMSYALMQHFAPTLAKKKWRALHGHFLAMTNGEQNGFDGGTPHSDYINNVDIGTSLPRYDKMQRSFQGSFIRGDVVNGTLVCKPGIHGIDSTRPLPSINDIVSNNWYVTAVTAGTTIHNFPQGDGQTIVYPFIFDRPISFPLQWFQVWERDYLPNPFEFYL